MPGFVAIARAAFAFLEEDYGFAVKGQSHEGGGQITYVNVKNGVAVKPTYEIREGFVFVFIYRLQDGEIRENTYPITDQSVIHCFEFNDVLTVDQRMKPSYMYDEHSKYFDEHDGLRHFVTDFAVRLKTHGKKLLAGDFGVLPEVERIIKNRAREMRS